MIVATIILLSGLLAVVKGRGDIPEEIIIAGLYPKSVDGELMQVAAEIAMENILAGKGVDLPALTASGTQLKLVNFDSKGSQKGALDAMLGAVDVGARAVVGPAYSSEGVIASLLGTLYDLPILSYSATSPALSDKEQHPNFFRNVPSDATQGKALVEMLQKYGHTRCVLVHTEDAYGRGLSDVFRNEARLINITVEDTVTIPLESTVEGVVPELANAVELVYGANPDPANLQIRGLTVFVLISSAGRDLATVLTAAESLATPLVGPPFTWFMSDGGTSLAIDVNEQFLALKPSSQIGLVGTTLLLASGSYYEENYLAAYNVIRESGKLFPVNGEMVMLPEQPHPWSPMTYDGVLMYAHAINDLFEQELYDFTPAELMDAMRALEVQGTIGVQKFDATQDGAPVYDIVNSRVPGEPWQKVGGYSGGVELADDAVIFADGGTVPLKSEFKEPIAGELVALIVILALLALAAVGAVGYWLWNKSRKAKLEAEAEAASRPAEEWTLAQENERLDAIGNPKTAVSKLGASQSLSSTSLFDAERGQRIEVRTHKSDKLTLINKAATPAYYRITVPQDAAVKVTAVPGVGVVPKSGSRDVKLGLVLEHTSKVQRWVQVEFFNDETMSSSTGYAVLPLSIEGEVSPFLDPAEIELQAKPLGSDSHGVTYAGKYRGQVIAATVPHAQANMSSDAQKAFEKETALLAKMRNRFIVGFIGASQVPGKLCLCTELLERGSVHDLLYNGQLTTMLKVKMMLDGMRAIEFLHENGVLYRDFKPENLLVVSESTKTDVNCKLTNFKTAVSVESTQKMAAHTSSIGTPLYMAPEAMAGNKPYNGTVDVYSFAISMWELLAEEQPFSKLKRVWDLPRVVMNGERPVIDEGEWPSSLCSLIADCWMQDASRRPHAAEVVLRLDKFHNKSSGGGGGKSSSKSRSKSKSSSKKSSSKGRKSTK